MYPTRSQPPIVGGVTVTQTSSRKKGNNPKMQSAQAKAITVASDFHAYQKNEEQLAPQSEAFSKLALRVEKKESLFSGEAKAIISQLAGIFEEYKSLLCPKTNGAPSEKQPLFTGNQSAQMTVQEQSNLLKQLQKALVDLPAGSKRLEDFRQRLPLQKEEADIVALRKDFTEFNERLIANNKLLQEAMRRIKSQLESIAGERTLCSDMDEYHNLLAEVGNTMCQIAYQMKLEANSLGSASEFFPEIEIHGNEIARNVKELHDLKHKCIYGSETGGVIPASAPEWEELEMLFNRTRVNAFDLEIEAAKLEYQRMMFHAALGNRKLPDECTVKFKELQAVLQGAKEQTETAIVTIESKIKETFGHLLTEENLQLGDQERAVQYRKAKSELYTGEFLKFRKEAAEKVKLLRNEIYQAYTQQFSEYSKWIKTQIAEKDLKGFAIYSSDNTEQLLGDLHRINNENSVLNNKLIEIANNRFQAICLNSTEPKKQSGLQEQLDQVGYIFLEGRYALTKYSVGVADTVVGKFANVLTFGYVPALNRQAGNFGMSSLVYNALPDYPEIAK
jgi:hypothetical protein